MMDFCPAFMTILMDFHGDVNGIGKNCEITPSDGKGDRVLMGFSFIWIQVSSNSLFGMLGLRKTDQPINRIVVI